MVYILSLVFVQVYGVWLQDAERLAIFMAFLTFFLFLNMSIQPHRFAVVYWMEIIGLGLVVVATYLLQIALLN